MAAADQAQVHLYRRAAGADQPRDRPRPHQLFSLSGAQTGRLSSTDPNLHEHPDPHRDRPAHPRRLRRRAGPCHAVGRLQPDRAAARRPYLRRAAAARTRSRRGEDIHNLHRAGIVRRGQPRHPRPRPRRSTSRSSTASRAGAWRGGWSVTAGRGAGDDRPLFRALPGHPRLYRRHARPSARETGFTTTLFGRKTHFPRIKSKSSTSARAPSAPRSTRRSRAPRADIIKRAMARMGPALAAAGLTGTRMLMQVHDELVFEVPEAEVERRDAGDPPGDGARGRAGDHAQRAARRRDRHRAELGRGALSATSPGASTRPAPSDIAALAKGGRTNFFGFLLRLAARASRSCSSPAACTAPDAARPLRLCGDRRRARRAARDARAEARARPAALDHRPAACLCRLGRAARRLHRLGGRERRS